MSDTYDGVQIQILDWDQECKTDFMLGRGFRITEPGTKKTFKTLNGIQSPKFCSDWSDEDAFSERYSCQCGEYRGKTYEGEICPKCKKMVKFKDVDLKITGWIILDNDYIIHPIMYNILNSIMGKVTRERKYLEEIVTYAKTIEKDGQIVPTVAEGNPFYGIGITEFRDRFYEIMEYFREKRPGKSSEIDMLTHNVDLVFQHCIPVYSSVLRPLQFKDEALLYTKIDRIYNSIFTSSALLNDIEAFERKQANVMKKKKERYERGEILSKIQARLMKLWAAVFEQIDQKTGHIKGEILGGKLNFSSRDVIIPDPRLRPDEIAINYTAFLELYKYEIISCIVNIEGVSMYDAYGQWSKARVVYSDKIYGYMQYILKKFKPRVLINRNPSIDYGSISCVKITSVKNQYPDDYTMSMPPQILNPMNADRSRSEDRVIYLMNFANA